MRVILENMITKEEYQFLKEFESEFSRVLDSQYKLPTPMSRDEKILEIVHKYEPKYMHKWGCSQCSFELYKRAGMLYRAYVPEPEVEKVEEPKIEEKPIETVEEPKVEEKPEDQEITVESVLSSVEYSEVQKPKRTRKSKETK